LLIRAEFALSGRQQLCFFIDDFRILLRTIA
jgi:hypothetical protein